MTSLYLCVYSTVHATQAGVVPGNKLGFHDAIFLALCNLTVDHISEWFRRPDSHVES